MKVTASRTGILEHCAYVARDDAQWFDVAGPAAERGTKFHQLIASYVDTADTAGILDADTGPLFASAVEWVDAFGREKLSAEVAFAWDPATDTAEQIEAKDRDYSAGNGRLCGTADLVAISRAMGVGYIGDWKTGDASKSTPQLRTLAVMLARAEGLDSVTVEALEVTAMGVRSVCREELDAFALAAHAGELAEQLARVDGAEPMVGPHCVDLYCPARATCPEVEAAAMQLLPAEALVAHRFSPVVTSAEHAVWMLDRVRLVEAACDVIKRGIRAACPEEGWPLDDGNVLVETTRRMPRFSKDRAIRLLKQLGATDEQIDGCEYVATEGAGLRVRKGRAA